MCKKCNTSIAISPERLCNICDERALQKISVVDKNYKINTLLSWLDAADQTNKEDKLTSVTLFSDGSGRILLDGEQVDDFYNIEEALEKLEITVNTQKSC
jgi:hypothetical protein